MPQRTLCDIAACHCAHDRRLARPGDPRPSAAADRRDARRAPRRSQPVFHPPAGLARADPRQPDHPPAQARGRWLPRPARRPATAEHRAPRSRSPVTAAPRSTPTRTRSATCSAGCSATPDQARHSARGVNASSHVAWSILEAGPLSASGDRGASRAGAHSPIAKIDRLGRSAEAITLCEDAARSGWQVVVVDLGLDTTMESREAVLWAFSMLARMELRRPSTRVRYFHAERRRQGLRRRDAAPVEIADRIRTTTRDSRMSASDIRSTLKESRRFAGGVRS